MVLGKFNIVLTGMANVTDHWASFQRWEEDEKHTQRIANVLSIADFPSLCRAALKIRNHLEQKLQSRKRKRARASKPTACTVDTTKFAAGMQNVVIELKFSDGVSWIARIRFSHEGDDDKEVERSMLSEVTTMKYIRARTSIPAPEVFGYDFSPANDFGFRYIVMELLPGRIADHDLKDSIPEEKWTALADQLAGHMYQLSQLRFTSIGRLLPSNEITTDYCISLIDSSEQVTTSLEYFYAHRQKPTRWIKSDREGDDQWATAAWILEQAVPAMVVPEFLHGPFPLYHVDLHFGNILVDEDFNITGMIDWTNVQTVPIERFTTMPEIATFPRASEEANARRSVFRKALKEGFRMREVEGRGQIVDEDAEMPLISDLIGTPRWEIVTGAIIAIIGEH